MIRETYSYPCSSSVHLQYLKFHTSTILYAKDDLKISENQPMTKHGLIATYTRTEKSNLSFRNLSFFIKYKKFDG